MPLPLRSVAATLGLIALLVAALLPTAAAGVAAAHAGGLTTSASVPTILRVEPAAPELTVTVVEFGARLRLDNAGPTSVTVQPLAGSQVTALPTVPPGGSAYWSDPRITAAAASDRPPDGVLGWQIPLTVGGQPAMIVGQQYWPPPPQAALWWLLALAAAAVPIALGLLAARRGWGRGALAGATALVIAAHVIHVAGSALVPLEQPYLLMLLSAGGFGVAAWLVGIAGIVTALRERTRGGGSTAGSTGLLMCCIAGALLGLIVMPVDVLSFHDAVVPFAWGGRLDRVLIAITLGGGLGVAAASAILLRRAVPAAGPAAG